MQDQPTFILLGTPASWLGTQSMDRWIAHVAAFKELRTPQTPRGGSVKPEAKELKELRTSKTTAPQNTST